MAKRTSGSMKRILGVLVAASILMFLSTPTVMALTFNDGMVHILSADVNDYIYVYNNVNPPHNPTTLEYYGQAWGVFVHDSSTLIYQGSSDSTVGAFDNSKLILNSYIDYGVLLGGNATLIGGAGYQIWASGGRIFDNPFFNILEQGGTATTTIYSMTIFEGVSAKGNLRIFGGNYHGEFYVNGDGDVTMYGKSFSVPFGTYAASDQLTSLSGTLSDGGNVGISYLLIRDQGELTLVKTPEPSLIMLHVISLMSVVGLRRWWKG